MKKPIIGILLVTFSVLLCFVTYMYVSSKSENLKSEMNTLIEFCEEKDEAKVQMQKEICIEKWHSLSRFYFEVFDEEESEMLEKYFALLDSAKPYEFGKIKEYATLLKYMSDSLLESQSPSILTLI